LNGVKHRVRKLLLLTVVGAAGMAVTTARKSSKSRASGPIEPASASTWPPFERVEEPAKTGAIGSLATAAEQAVDDQIAATHRAAAWVLPVDGACPNGFPIKANDNSRIYHAPGGRFYERTKAERCYATADAAERDGYRRAKA
jgi:hypothetical protein